MGRSPFEIFGLEPRPAINDEELKKRFIKLGSALHPDRSRSSPTGTGESTSTIHGLGFTEVNEAYRILSDPKLRLQSLYSVLTGHDFSNPKTPEDLLELSFEIGKFNQDVSLFLSNSSKNAGSHLESAVRKATAKKWKKTGDDLLLKLASTEKNQADQLDLLDQSWTHSTTADSVLLNRLEDLISSYAYISKCRNQLKEKLVQLEIFITK